nr:uracil-DNA glycosylase [bacterium]
MIPPGDNPVRIARDAKAFLLQLEEEGLEWVPSRRRESSRRRSRKLATPSLRDRYLELRDRARACASCRLSETRRNVVFGEGKMGEGVFIIGEGPGATEDATGRPFVGRAGALLDKMLAAVGLSRRDVYITNIVKCRPPGNRDPNPDEIIACW